MQVENVNGKLYGIGGAVPYGTELALKASSVTDRFQFLVPLKLKSMI